MSKANLFIEIIVIAAIILSICIALDKTVMNKELKQREHDINRLKWQLQKLR